MGAGGDFGHNKVGVGSSWATMPVLGQLPWELLCQLAGQRNKWRIVGLAWLSLWCTHL